MAVLDRAFKRKRFIKESNPGHKNLYYFKPNDTFFFSLIILPSATLQEQKGFLSKTKPCKGLQNSLQQTLPTRPKFEECLAKFKLASKQAVIRKKYEGKPLSVAGELCFKTFVGSYKGEVVSTYHPAVQNLKQAVMENWSLIKNQPLLRTTDPFMKKANLVTQEVTFKTARL